MNAVKPRAKPGTKPIDGATDLKKCTVLLDPETIAKAKRIGGGNLSAGIRLMAAAGD